VDELPLVAAFARFTGEFDRLDDFLPSVKAEETGAMGAGRPNGLPHLANVSSALTGAFDACDCDSCWVG